jgi:hypothetical protein
MYLGFNGRGLVVYFPAVNAVSLQLYIREDGATFYDAALTQLARGVP